MELAFWGLQGQGPPPKLCAFFSPWLGKRNLGKHYTPLHIWEGV